MDLSADARLPFPRAVVFEAYRDRLPELVAFLPNVRAIEVRSRKEEPPVTELVNVWHGGGEIPAAARAFLSEAMLSWTDHARWDQSAWTCSWRVEAHVFTEAVQCQGLNRFLEDGEETVLQIRGSLTIAPDRLKGVPRLLASSVAKTAEELLGGKIRPNLVEVSGGLRRYLEQNR
jgi:hypothetical protein